MQSPDRQPEDQANNPLWGRLALFGFGLALLAFLTLIERQSWFAVKPATGTARAMSLAAESPTINRTVPVSR